MSQVEFDPGTAKMLERMYATRDAVRRRRLVGEALAAQPAEQVLDVGCGPGFYLDEISGLVGDDGRVAGIDASPAMLTLAEHRTRGRTNVELGEGSATALPFGDAQFDAALSVQVLEYVEDVDAALAELARVVRPGGRVVLWDVDWATLSMNASDVGRHERVLHAWDRHLVHPSLPRSLSSRARAAGFVDLRLEGHAFTTTELVPDSYGGSVVEVVNGYLHGLDGFPNADADGWTAEQRELDAAGEFYFSCVQCCLWARRGED